MDRWKLSTKKFKNSWLVQLATSRKKEKRKKKKLTNLVKNCVVNLIRCPTEINLNVLPLDSYDFLIGMGMVGET